MKKVLIVTLLFIISLVGCGKPSCLIGAGSTVEENTEFNHYNFTSFRGTYSFSKQTESTMKLRIVTYTKDDYHMMIEIKKDSEVIKQIESSSNNNQTTYIDLEKGDYTFVLTSQDLYVGEILFNWNYQEGE